MTKRVFLIFAFIVGCAMAYAQEFNVTNAGVSTDGQYLVKVVVSTKKNPAKTAENLVKEYAVRGVMFRGVAAADDYPSLNPLISDPAVEQTKAAELSAFWNEELYKNFATLTPQSSLSVLKNKQTKLYESSAQLTVNKESLLKWLETNGIVKGFSNLW